MGEQGSVRPNSFHCAAQTVCFFPNAQQTRREENSNLLQHSCLGNLMDRRAWWSTEHGVAKESDTSKRLNNEQQMPSTHLLCPGSSVTLTRMPHSFIQLQLPALKSPVVFQSSIQLVTDNLIKFFCTLLYSFHNIGTSSRIKIT